MMMKKVTMTKKTTSNDENNKKKDINKKEDEEVSSSSDNDKDKNKKTDAKNDPMGKEAAWPQERRRESGCLSVVYAAVLPEHDPGIGELLNMAADSATTLVIAWNEVARVVYYSVGGERVGQ